MLPSMEWAFSLSRTIQRHASTPIHSPSLTENISSLHCLYFTVSQAISGIIIRKFSLPRFSCPYVVGISLISQHYTKARKAAKKLDADPHCDARQMMARTRCICICRDSKRNLETKLRPSSEGQSGGKQGISVQLPTFQHLYLSEPAPHLEMENTLQGCGNFS